MPTTFRHVAAGSAEEILDSVVAPVYEASHSDVIDDPFYSTERFVERVRGYLHAPGFELVAAHDGDVPIGLAFGYALPVSSRWWEGLTTPVEEGFTDETGSRTFALNELMVVPDRQGEGIAHAMHDDLLGGRSEERATLLVREDNVSAQQAYARWGWRKVGKLRPYPDSPHFDAMVLPLPIGR